MSPPPALVVLGGVAGLALGSFAVTTGVRLSRGETYIRGRSRCDACGAGLSFIETTPLISFVALSGACAVCRARIDRVHLAGETAGALAIAVSLAVADWAHALLLSALGLLLITSATVDWKVRRLPDGLTLAVAALGLASSGLGGRASLEAGIVAALVVALALLVLRWPGARRGRAGLGLGDVKLAAALALGLGAATPWMIAAAAIAGLLLMPIVRPADGRLPFGPALALAGWTLALLQSAGIWPTTF